jgi:hypothetical protein
MQTHAQIYRRRHYGKEPRQGPAFCTECHAVRKTRRWSYQTGPLAEFPMEGATAMICPGCQALAEKHYEGEVRLSADWSPERWDMLLERIHNLAHYEVQKNPLSRIGDVEKRPGQLCLMTTTGFLALAIGRAIHNAFKGKLEIHPAAGEAVTRLHWTA